jgi:hypothetical protein
MDAGQLLSSGLGKACQPAVSPLCIPKGDPHECPESKTTTKTATKSWAAETWMEQV